MPVVLLASALKPWAVLLPPVVLLKRALHRPVAVLMLPVCVLLERLKTIGGVVCSSRVVEQCFFAGGRVLVAGSVK